jgi:hypothetical protein
VGNHLPIPAPTPVKERMMPKVTQKLSDDSIKVRNRWWPPHPELTGDETSLFAARREPSFVSVVMHHWWTSRGLFSSSLALLILVVAMTWR